MSETEVAAEPHKGVLDRLRQWLKRGKNGEASENGDTLDARLSNIKAGLDIGVQGLTIAPPLVAASVVPVLNILAERISTMRANIRDKCDTIAKIQGLMKLLAETTQQTASVANGQPDEHTRQETATRATDILSTRVDTLKMTLDAILASAKENPRSRFYQMFWFAETDKENLKSIGQRIDTAMSNFKFQGGIEMRHTLGQIAADIKDRYLLEVEKEAREALKALNPANASYTSAQLEEKSRLQPGTRSTILRALAEWAVDGEPNQRVYILYGQAGLGKSSIAHAFCRQLPKDRLGASFFFLRGSGECSDVYRVFTTIAHQLAHSITALQSHIVKASRIHGGGTGQLLDHQFDTLILEPLRSLLDISDMPIILLVVDGVDECEKKPEGAVPDMLRLLLKVAQEIPFLRVLIATRPEPYIMDALNSCPHGNTIIWRDLQKEPDVDSDIRAFIDAEFSKCTTAGEFTLCEEHSDAAQTLTRLSDGLFIFASTIVKYLTQSRRLSAERYNVLLGAQSHLGSGNIYNKLDTLYVGIIGKSFEDIQGDSKHIAYVKQLLTWVALFHPFSENSEAVASAAGLETSGIPTSITLDFLDRLRSVFIVDGNITLTTPLQACHASFPQFITDPARCTDPAFLVDPPSGHAVIAVSLLDLLARDNVDSLRDADGYMPPMWNYAKWRWVVHLLQARYTPELGQALRGFVETHLDDCLQDRGAWINPFGSKIIPVDMCAKVRRWYEKSGPDDGLVEALGDIIDRRVKELVTEAAQSPDKFHKILDMPRIKSWSTANGYTPLEIRQDE